MSGDGLTASIHIAAAPERVFEYFVRADAMIRWLGEHAALDPRVGGEFAVDIRGVPVRGRYLEIEAPHRLLVSWGHAGSDRIPPGATTVEVQLSPADGGTLVTVRHTGLPEPEATAHKRGWVFFLERLAERVMVAGRAR